MSDLEFQEGILKSAARHASEGPKEYLSTYPETRPRPDQLRVLDYVMRVVQQPHVLGRLGDPLVTWRLADDRAPRAQTRSGANGRSSRTVVDVRADLAGNELAAVLFHEACHCRQLYDGSWSDMTATERELEAISFSARAMRGELL